MISGGRRKQALLGDAMEAVIAAVYLDSGYDTARDFILRFWRTRMKASKTMPVIPKQRYKNGRKPVK